MDDIIVIILTLVVAVFGFLNQKKKKAAAQAPVSEKAKEPSGFWDMIMDEQAAEVEPVMEYAEKESHYVVPEPVDSEHNVREIKPKYNFSAANEGKSEIEDVFENSPKRKKQVTIDGEKFSLKKAVIYSEIMNRKYS